MGTKNEANSPPYSMDYVRRIYVKDEEGYIVEKVEPGAGDNYFAIFIGPDAARHARAYFNWVRFNHEQV